MASLAVKGLNYFWDFKIYNSDWIIKGSDNEDSDNQGSTVYINT